MMLQSCIRCYVLYDNCTATEQYEEKGISLKETILHYSSKIQDSFLWM